MTPNDPSPTDLSVLLRGDADPDALADLLADAPEALAALRALPDRARALDLLGRVACRRPHDPEIARTLAAAAEDDDAAPDIPRLARRILGSLARWEAWPESPVAPLVLAVDAARRAGDLTAWSDTARALCDAAPWHPRSWSEWGFVQQSRECWSGARDAWARRRALRPDDIDGHVLWARAAAHCGQEDDALQELDRCVAAAPDSAFAVFERAALRERRGENRPALEDYRRAAALDPDDASWWGVVRCALALDDWEAVCEGDAGLIALDPDDPEAWSRYGYALARAGHWEASSDATWEAGRRDPGRRAIGNLPGADWLAAPQV